MSVMTVGTVAFSYRGMERLSCIAFVVALITDAANIFNRLEFMFPRTFVTESTLTRCNRVMYIIGLAHLVVAFSSYARVAIFCCGKEIIGTRMER